MFQAGILLSPFHQAADIIFEAECIKIFFSGPLPQTAPKKDETASKTLAQACIPML